MLVNYYTRHAQNEYSIDEMLRWMSGKTKKNKIRN